jgi:hypothetical protein
MPLFEFYAPLPFLVGAILFWAKLDVILILKLLYIISNALTALGAYFLGKQLFGKTGGWVTAAAYTLAPYRAVNLFLRGALSEAWAMMAMPWILFGIVLIVKKERSGFWIFLSGLITLLLSHNLTTLMFVPVSGLFAAVYWYLNARTQAGSLLSSAKSFLPILGGYLLAVGVCAFYIFPALTENQFTQINKIFSGYFYYANHFLYIRQFFNPIWGYGGSSWGPDDNMSFFLGYGQLIGIGLTAVTGVWAVRSRNFSVKQMVIGSFFGITLLGAAFMTLLKSKFIWDAVPFLTTIQFPWRWLSIVSLMMALLAGLSMVFIRKKLHRIIAAVCIIFLCILSNTAYFRPEKYLEKPEDIYYTDVQRIQSQMSSILPDYIPVSMGKIGDVKSATFLVPGGTEKQVEVLVDRGHEKLFKTSFISEVEFNPQIASFPGWVVEIDGKQVEWSSKGQFGTIMLDVPAGEHLVGVYFGRTPVRAISDSISFLSLLTVFGVATYGSLARQHTRFRS